MGLNCRFISISVNVRLPPHSVELSCLLTLRLGGTERTGDNQSKDLLPARQWRYKRCPSTRMGSGLEKPLHPACLSLPLCSVW